MGNEIKYFFRGEGIFRENVEVSREKQVGDKTANSLDVH
jgi:hypothetical protein